MKELHFDIFLLMSAFYQQFFEIFAAKLERDYIKTENFRRKKFRRKNFGGKTFGQIFKFRRKNFRTNFFKRKNFRTGVFNNILPNFR